MAPALTPRQAWAMRLDEAVRMIAARAALMNRREGPRPRKPADGQWTDLPDGRRQLTIGSMETLRTVLSGGIG